MVRIIIKGGVWKNTEDEVLKAAIAKYGKNQWRVYRSRWYEWLDPSIKKTEWSKTEDEKLLHLAKLMPTQWRTIAPIVGRTATQCLERYQKLLDEAEAKDNEELGLTGPDGDAGPSADDVRRLRPGEIDPDPETKPARPDPIDMDEDEKEMLSEARARLANTQGKKAKRKARERQLEEARRLAVLQKKRELKAAGIIMRHKTKKKGMDYNADIPFEKKPAPGFYDTSEEQARVAAAPVGQTLRRMENKRKPDAEEAERKKRQRKNGKEGEGPGHQTKFIPARDAQIQKLKEAESISRRRKLMLPSAQVGEAELEEIVKIGQAGENAKALVGGGSDASGRLLSDYEGLENARMARTPRTAPQEDNILSEARNLRNMSIAQTPLLGEENTPMHTNTSGGTGFESATPRHQVAFTPNPLATPLRSGTGDVSATPRDMSVGSTPLRTPLRDNLSINPDGFPSIGDTPREQRLQAHSAKRALQTGFMNLPKPENNFELLVPEEEENEGGDGEDRGLVLSEEDAEERDAKLRRAREEEEKRILSRRTQVVRLGLPRPANVDAATLLEQLSLYDDVEEGELGAAQKLVDAELASIIQHDSLEYPIPGTLRPGGAKSTYEIPDDEAINAAKSLIHLELASLVGFPQANVDQVREGLIALSKADSVDDHASWASVRRSLTFDSSSKTWVNPSQLSSEQRIAGYDALLSEHQNIMGQEAQKIAKHEKKLGKVLGGYQARSQAISKRVTDAFAELQTTYSNYQSFVRLQTNEAAVGPRRVDTLKEEVENLERREKTLQERYAELAAERKESEAKVAALEEKLMAEAEKFNEASLAEMEGVESYMGAIDKTSKGEAAAGSRRITNYET
ncbi:Pre-mRNA-splicing factor CEF1 [Lentinula edodes]|uniref:Pre-mRNA-splicing factor CEF1 n=1 Tax=Lentinula edodes TaxID=5353 RepID=A0A1Q3EJX8_LENED|nr:Pre-mRNA-splicing factor CEF1 [Lentinula edodes]